MEDLVKVTEILFNLLAAVGLFIGGLWAYTRYSLERGILPPVQFDVDCKKVGCIGNDAIIEFAIRLKNVGSSTLVARWITLDIRYITKNDKDLSYLKESHRAGRLIFKHSLIKDLDINRNDLVEEIIKNATQIQKKSFPHPRHSRGLPILFYDTFVQPGVDQMYTFVTKLPTEVVLVLMHASFEYAQTLNRVQVLIFRLSRSLGLIHYSLEHVARPHTVERAVWING